MKPEACTSTVSFLDIIKFSITVLAAWRLNYRRLEGKKINGTLRECACKKLLEKKCFEVFDRL
jgi:hypothetical protein